MIDPGMHACLKNVIARCIAANKSILDSLRDEARPLLARTRKIQPRSTTSISLVAADGGNNQLQFDPFLVQLVRIVDSSNNEYCLEALSPSTPLRDLNAMHLDKGTALGKMMAYLNVKSLDELSPMIHAASDGQPVFHGWVQVYRELMEWAVLFALLEKSFGTDTLIIRDGLLRSKVFSGVLFHTLLDGIAERIEKHKTDANRKIMLVGVAKHSKVLTRYRLAMALERILLTDYPAYVEIPREIEEKSYIWSEFARGDDSVVIGGEANKFVGGKMFLVKFGSSPRDPVWPVDIFLPQSNDAQAILGCMLADAQNGFPVPCYPLCLQKAHENAAIVDFDLDILQDCIYEGIRETLGNRAEVLDAFRLQDADPARKRYGRD